MSNVQEIECVYGLQDQEELAVFVRGHVDCESFVLRAKEFLNEFMLEADGELVAKHEWWRNVPVPEGMKYITAEPNSRGAYAVTVCDLQDWKR